MTDDLWAWIDHVPGWLNRDEADLLFALRSEPWCEIGCWEGRSARVLALGGHGYCVDTFEGTSGEEIHKGVDADELHQRFVNNLSALPVTVLRGDFFEMVHDVPWHLRLLHIDGDHSYNATAEAFRDYAPRVGPGGHVVFHDVWPDEAGRDPYPGVRRAYLEAAETRGWAEVVRAGRSGALRKL